MTRHYLATTAIIIATTTGAFAQTTPVELPALLQGLDLQQVELDSKSDGQSEYEGRLPDGTKIEATFDMAGNLIEVEADDAALPQSIVDAILPQAVRGTDIIAQFAMIDEIKVGNDSFEIKGEGASGDDMRAQFDAEGGILRFGRDGDDRRGGQRHGRGGDHEGRDRSEMRDEMRERMRGEGGPRQGQGGRPQAPAPAFDTVAANRQLTEAGYGAFGLMRQEGPRILLDATNPDGETVTLELDRDGVLVRETAR